MSSKQSLSKIVWLGIVTFLSALVGGIVSSFATDLYNATKEWLLSPSLPITIPQLIFTLIAVVGVVLIIYGLRKTGNVERIEQVQAYIFFPKGTPEEDKTLEYHEKHFHKKLVVNFKKKPPQAYRLPAANTSYGWKLIKKYPDLWISVEDPIYPDPDTQKWCEERGYGLNPWSVSKKELLEADTLMVEPKKSFEKLPKSTTRISIEKTRSLFSDSKLMEAYSPIHAMIVRINRVIPRETALQMDGIGCWVEASLIDSDSISEIFNQHNDKLWKRDLDMWLEIEKEIKARNGFWLDKDRQMWFDELETEYNRLTKHQQR